MNSMRSTRQWLQRLWRGHPVLMVLLACGPAVVLAALAPLRTRLSGMLATGLPMTGGAARAAPPWSSSLPCCRVGDRALHAGDVGAQGLGLRFEGARRVDTCPCARSKPARLVSYPAHQRLGVGDLRVYRCPRHRGVKLPAITRVHVRQTSHKVCHCASLSQREAALAAPHTSRHGQWLSALGRLLLRRLPAVRAQQEAVEQLLVRVGLCEHLALGAHEGRQPLGATHREGLLEDAQRPNLLVQRVELPGERRVVFDEGAGPRLLGPRKPHALRTRRLRLCDHSSPPHQAAPLLLAMLEGAARNAECSISQCL
jgi:hypothetical protein